MSMDKQERYGVYHANDLHAMIAPQADHWLTDRSRHYTHVADVEAKLSQVFELTNHINHPWTDNPEVGWHTAAHEHGNDWREQHHGPARRDPAAATLSSRRLRRHDAGGRPAGARRSPGLR